VASNLGLSDWAFALAAFAPPGTSREEFPQDGGERYQMVRREAVILNYTASAAWKRGDRFGVGASLVWVHVPRLVYSLVIDGSPFAGASNPVSSDLDMLATTTGSATFTFNAIVGAWFRPIPAVELGVSGQIVPATVKTHSRLSVLPLSTSLGTVVLTRDGVPADDVSVTLPLPLVARAGGRYRHLVGTRELYDVELDLEYTTWSRVHRFTVETRGLQANYGGQVLDISRIDIEKQWRDTVAVRLGGDVAVLPGRWSLRAGMFYETAVAAAATQNVDFPGGQRIGVGAGSSLFFFQRWEVSLAYQFLAQPSVTVSEADARVYQQVPGSSCQAPYTDPATCNPNTLGRPAPVVNAGTYGATAHILSLGVVYRFGPTGPLNP
jgi:long-subunit fatty acid transport protein